jgi:hypothetical protein
MTDIVERLRNNVGGESYTWKTITEAADEIERLREALDLFLAIDLEKTSNWLYSREKAAALVKEYLSTGKDFLQVTKTLGEKE